MKLLRSDDNLKAAEEIRKLRTHLLLHKYRYPYIHPNKEIEPKVERSTGTAASANQ
jgi:hypothetical protein